MAVGIKRKNTKGQEREIEIAVILYPDGVELEVSKKAYRLNGYAPPFEQLPRDGASAA